MELLSPRPDLRAASQTPGEKMASSHGIIVVWELECIKNVSWKAWNKLNDWEEWRDVDMYSNYGFHWFKKKIWQHKTINIWLPEGWKWALVNGFLSDQNESGRKLWIIFALCDAALSVISSLLSSHSEIYKQVLHKNQRHKQILWTALSSFFNT